MEPSKRPIEMKLLNVELLMPVGFYPLYNGLDNTRFTVQVSTDCFSSHSALCISAYWSKPLEVCGNISDTRQIYRRIEVHVDLFGIRMQSTWIGAAEESSEV